MPCQILLSRLTHTTGSLPQFFLAISSLGYWPALVRLEGAVTAASGAAGGRLCGGCGESRLPRGGAVSAAAVPPRLSSEKPLIIRMSRRTRLFRHSGSFRELHFLLRTSLISSVRRSNARWLRQRQITYS